MWFVHHAEPHWAKATIAKELYRSFTAWDDRRSFSMPMTMRIFPYLNCSDGSSAPPIPTKADLLGARKGVWSPVIGSDVFSGALLSLNSENQDAGYAHLIEERYSTVQMAGLIACIQASLFASRCGESVRDATYGQNDRLEAERDPALSDALQSKSFCLYYPAVTAYLRQSAEGSKK